jgi:probable F420-dependent oxidoreductase
MKMSMSLGTALPHDATGMSIGRDLATIASAAERAGFDGVYVTDHPFPHPRWFDHGGHHAYDPFVQLAFAAAVTTTLRVQTHLVVAPYRNPFLTAKSVVTLDVMSGGRLTLGVGAGYMDEEFAALGADLAERGALTSEAIVAMKAAWTGEPVHLRGRHFVADGNVLEPMPIQRPHPPLWVGGNSEAAIRRAVELADGWIPAPSRRSDHPLERHTDPLESFDGLAAGIAFAGEHAARIGRTAPLDIPFMPAAFGLLERRQLSTDELLDSCGKLAAMGVTYLMGGVGGGSVEQRVDAIERFGVEVLPALADL